MIFPPANRSNIHSNHCNTIPYVLIHFYLIQPYYPPNRDITMQIILQTMLIMLAIFQ